MALVDRSVVFIPGSGHQKPVGVAASEDLALVVAELTDISLIVLTRQDEEHLHDVKKR